MDRIYKIQPWVNLSLFCNQSHPTNNIPIPLKAGKILLVSMKKTKPAFLNAKAFFISSLLTLNLGAKPNGEGRAT